MIAERYGRRPSELLGVSDGYAAYCIDEAAAIAGLYGVAHDRALLERPVAELDTGSMMIRGKIPIIKRKK